MLDFAKDKSLWARIREDDAYARHREELSELYARAFQTEPRSHSAEDILGNNDGGLWRLQFDHLQSSALLSLIYPENEEYYHNLVKTIWAYCNEYSWAPLGHFTEHYYGKTPEDFDPCLIDIFAASVGFALAEIKNLFADRFPRLLTDRISHELRRHIIDSYRTRTFFWESHDNNWTAVCTGGVGGVLMYEDPEEFYRQKDRLHGAMECYLASFSEDGMCVEGVGYWEFGFGFFSAFASLERELTEGREDWFARPKVKRIAQFLQKMFLDTNVLTTFGDCNVHQRLPIGVPYLLRSVYGDEVEPLPRMAGCVKDNTHLNFSLRSLIYFDPSHVCKPLDRNVTYHTEGSCYLTRRTSAYGFAAKGGHNGESHNHVDVGNFILSRHDRQIICDIGAGPYEDGYHTDRRYTFFHPSAYAHNLPILDGVGQDHRGQDPVVIAYDAERAAASMDLAVAYNLPHLTSLARAFTFTDTSVTLTDTFALTRETAVTERFISMIEPVTDGASLVIDDVTLSNPHGIVPTITVKEVMPHLGSKPHNVYLIDYVLPKGQTSFALMLKTP